MISKKPTLRKNERKVGCKLESSGVKLLNEEEEEGGSREILKKEEVCAHGKSKAKLWKDLVFIYFYYFLLILEFQSCARKQMVGILKNHVYPKSVFFNQDVRSKQITTRAF